MYGGGGYSSSGGMGYGMGGSWQNGWIVIIAIAGLVGFVIYWGIKSKPAEVVDITTVPPTLPPVQTSKAPVTPKVTPRVTPRVTTAAPKPVQTTKTSFAPVQTTTKAPGPPTSKAPGPRKGEKMDTKERRDRQDKNRKDRQERQKDKKDRQDRQDRQDKKDKKDRQDRPAKDTQTKDTQKKDAFSDFVPQPVQSPTSLPSSQW